MRSSGASNQCAIEVNDHFRFAVFNLLVFMCFGQKLEESKIREIEAIQHRLLTTFNRFLVLDCLPWITRMLLPNRWAEVYELKKKRDEVLIPIIRARKKLLQAQSQDDNTSIIAAYVDTLFTLQLSEPEDTTTTATTTTTTTTTTNNSNRRRKRKLSEEEMVTICSEFLNAGTDTTSTALEWIMANLVKYPKVQDKLYQEIQRVVGVLEVDEVNEKQVSKMKYLKAVVLEGLRRHPPSYFSLPHAVTRKVDLGGYTIPENAIVFFTIAEMGWDAKVWDDPMEFEPERFLSSDNKVEEFDITGSKEIKMMPFGVGRRICPAFQLAMFHLEYYVANLVWKFEWRVVDGYEVELSEKQEFTVVMNNSLKTQIFPRQIVN
ncbi:cytochrome P450 89A2 [Beta vulgaris subsp. vulgaris]|uniref:cytochrome P450 89A2 n=1 Tax=Beta vulgaris subsp. vulgaris TaxID=3555 RepID=UPI002036BD18|nr:cytochrome P450 89A2 [Beta vulgaris subsp. vulgaris]